MVIKIKFEGSEEKINYDSLEELLKLDNYNDIIYLYCSENKLTSLPTLPSSLTELVCSDNYLTSLPTLPSSLIGLNCSDNYLTSLPSLPSSLTILYYYDNPIKKYIYKYFEDDWRKYREFQHSTLKKIANKIGSWFLECKYNPDYWYCQRRLTKEYKELFGEV